MYAYIHKNIQQHKHTHTHTHTHTQTHTHNRETEREREINAIIKGGEGAWSAIENIGSFWNMTYHLEVSISLPTLEWLLNQMPKQKSHTDTRTQTMSLLITHTCAGSSNVQ